MVKFEPFLGTLKTDLAGAVAENLRRIQKALASIEQSSSSSSARSSVSSSSSYVNPPAATQMKYAGMRHPVPDWSVNGSAPNIRIPAGKCYLYDNENWQGYIKSYDVPENEFTLTLNADQVVIVDYNGGSPVYVLANGTPRPWNFSDKIGVYRFWWDGVTIHSESTDSLGEGLPEKEAIRTSLTGFYARAYDEGVILGVSNTPVNHTATISAGYMFAGSILETLGAFNSSTDTFTRYVKNAGVWTPSNVTTYNTTHYNDNAGLVVAGAGKYLVDWVYRSVGNAVQSFSVLGTSAYNTVAEAKASVRRTDVPSVVAKHCVLVGRYIVKVGATVGEVESVYTEAFSFGGVANHNDLSGIQYAPSGVSGEAYHLSSNQADHVSELAAYWDMYFGSQLPAVDNAVDLGLEGTSPKRVKNIFAMVVKAATGIYRAGLELASVFAPISHASNGTTYGIADSSNYGHVKSSTTNPLMDGVADPGTAGALMANYNHRHPTDTSREAAHTRSEITAATDFRTLDVGCYRVSGGTWHANNPGTGVYNWGVVWVDWRGSAERIVIYKADVVPGSSSGGLWVDSAFGGTWRGWHHVASKQYLDTVYASLSCAHFTGDVTVDGMITGCYGLTISGGNGVLLSGGTANNGLLDARNELRLSGLQVNTSNSDVTLDDIYSGFVNTATFTAQRTLTLPNPVKGRILTLSNLGSSTTYGLRIVPSPGTTIHYGITPVLTGGNATGIKSLVLEGVSETKWAVMSMWTL